MDNIIRIYVGGLGESVTSDDLKKVFSAMGSVEGVDVIRTKGRSFSYIDFSPSSANSLHKLFSMYNGCVWKGGRLRLEKAKEHYLSRLRREWEEDAAPANATPVDEPEEKDGVSLAEIPAKDSKATKRTLKVYFPKLRKMKTLPFSGTGKHKYSFQRVEVPPYPIYFCPYEEHPPPESKQENHSDNLESQEGCINAEELSIMNGVMSRLFQRESSLNAANAESVHRNDDDNSELFSLSQPEETDGDEDNLITNVVNSKTSRRLLLSENQTPKTAPGKQESRSAGINRVDGNSKLMDATKEKKRNFDHQSKKKKLVDNEKSRKVGLPSELEKEERSQFDPNAGKEQMAHGFQKSVTEATKKRPPGSISWSQKSSWKALIADGENSTFSITKLLSSSASTNEALTVESKSKQKESVVEKALLNKKSEVSTGSGGPELTDSPVRCAIRQIKKSLSKGQRKKSSTKSDSANAKFVPDGGNAKETEVVANETAADTVMSVSYSCITAKEEKSKCSSPSLTKCMSENKSMDQTNYLEEKLTNEHRNEHADAPPVKMEGSLLNNSGRGSSWLHESSWTQLVGENNGSFSITQLLPDIASEKPDLALPGNIQFASRFVSARSVETNAPKESKSSVELSEATGKIVPGNVSQGNLHTDECSVDASTQAICGSHILEKSKANVGETCPFMRSATSLKDWANAKKALSGSRKRKKAED